MTDMNATIESWFAALNEPDPGRRAEHVERAWSDDGRWVDPPFEGQGHDAINQMISGVYDQYPGCRFRRVSAIDAHHDTVRYGWELVSPEGNVVVAGIDIGELGSDGRLRRISGFFGELAQEAAA